MARRRKAVNPYSPNYESEKEFVVNFLLNGKHVPQVHREQIKTLELDIHESKGVVGKLVMKTGLDPGQVWGRNTVENEVYKSGVKLTLFLGPRNHMQIFDNLYLREPTYTFSRQGFVIVDVPFRCAMTRMKKRKRTRRFNGLTVRQLWTRIAENYKMTPVFVGLGPDKDPFDDTFSFSQVSMHDAGLAQKLCRKFGWAWRVKDNQLMLYDPHELYREAAIESFGLFYNVGECTVEKFSPKIKKVYLKRSVQKVARNADGTPLEDPNKKGEEKTKEAADLVRGPPPKEPFRVSKKQYGFDSTEYRGKDSSSRVNVVREQPISIKRRLEKEKREAEKPDAGAVSSDVKADNYNITREFINAEIELAVPTMRILPMHKVSLHVGGSKYFSRVYACKQTKLVLDGETGKPTVSLLVKALAYESVVRIPDPKPEDLPEPEVTHPPLTTGASASAKTVVGIAPASFTGVPNTGTAPSDDSNEVVVLSDFVPAADEGVK